MRIAAPDLLPILRSRLQGDMLALIYLHPDEKYSLTAIARATGANVKAVHTEANRLVSGGFVREQREGQSRLLQAPASSPLAHALTDLLMLSYGPLPVLRDALGSVPGVDGAFIYGSWARRYAGEAGGVPNDVDVAVLGEADLDQIDEAARIAQQRLGRPVEIRRIPVALWNDTSGGNSFVAALRSSPRVDLGLGASDGDPAME